MKKSKVALLVGLLLSGSAMADSYPILGGGKGGSYDKMANTLAGFLSNEFPEHEFPIERTKGSEYNLKTLSSGAGAIGMAQMDAYATWLGGADDSSTVNAVGPLFKECVWLVGNKKGKVRDEDDLQDKGSSIAIGAPGSGSVITWEYMKSLEKGYANATPVYVKPTKVFGALSINASNAEAQSAMWVSRCDDPNTKKLETIKAQKGLILIDVDDNDLNDKHPVIGSPVYEFIKIKAAGQKITTISMTAAVFASDKLPEEIADELSSVVLRLK